MASSQPASACRRELPLETATTTTRRVGRRRSSAAAVFRTSAARPTAAEKPIRFPPFRVFLSAAFASGRRGFRPRTDPDRILPAPGRRRLLALAAERRKQSAAVVLARPSADASCESYASGDARRLQCAQVARRDRPRRAATAARSGAARRIAARIAAIAASRSRRPELRLHALLEDAFDDGRLSQVGLDRERQGVGALTSHEQREQGAHRHGQGTGALSMLCVAAAVHSVLIRSPTRSPHGVTLPLTANSVMRS